MTGINTLVAHQYWKKKGSETAYLDAIQFVALDLDEESEEIYVSLQGDEEGNFDTKLTLNAAKHVAKQLLAMVKDIEENPKGVKATLLAAKKQQDEEMKKFVAEMEAKKVDSNE